MRISGWPVMMAGSSDSGSAPLMMVRSAGGSLPDATGSQQAKAEAEQQKIASTANTRSDFCFRRPTTGRGAFQNGHRCYLAAAARGRVGGRRWAAASRRISCSAADVRRWSAAAPQAAAALTAGVCICFCCTCFSNAAVLPLCALGPATSRWTSASTKKMTAQYLVILVSALPEPAPNSASAAPPPKAMPAPASFFGSCISTSRINNRQLSDQQNRQNSNDKTHSNRLNRIFDDVSKTSRFQRRAAHQRAVHVRLAHQFPGVGRLDAAAVLDADFSGRGFVEQSSPASRG